ncbi:MAG: guanylate kinase [Ignavibacteria bacterium]|nr:guanylate kinase [Ignavibacteria bacterium]
MLYVIAAPSGAGKTTIVKELLRKNKDLVFSVSATTRDRRKGEIEGVDYFYLTKEEFKKKVDSGDLVEYELLFNGDYYGTLKSFVNECMKKGKSLIFDIDVKGALSLKKIYSDDALLIFIMPPDLETLKKRLTGRGTESIEQIEERIKRVELEINIADKFDVVVLNDDLEIAVNEIQKIIEIKNKTQHVNRNQRSGKDRIKNGKSIRVNSGCFKKITTN